VCRLDYFASGAHLMHFVEHAEAVRSVLWCGVCAVCCVLCAVCIAYVTAIPQDALIAMQLQLKLQMLPLTVRFVLCAV
jgi:hypothetical protein